MSNVMDNMPLMWLVPFIVPDMIHTLVMGQYIYLWVRKVERDEPTLEATPHTLGYFSTLMFFFRDLAHTLCRIVRKITEPVKLSVAFVQQTGHAVNQSGNKVWGAAPTGFEEDRDTLLMI